jgi:hypothetical protein
MTLIRLSKIRNVTDGRHGAYQSHIGRAPAVPPPSPPAAAATGTSAAAQDSPPAGTRAPPASRHVPSVAPESSRAATRRGKKQNILIKGLKTLVSMCHSNDTLIHECHQQMSQRFSHLEEHQREMCTSMGFETPEPIVYPPLPPPALEDPWAWYHNAKGNDEDDNDEENEEE